MTLKVRKRNLGCAYNVTTRRTKQTRAFTYDDENQLVSVADTMYQKTAFTYDAKGRLRIRQEYSWINSMWSLTDTINYVYDGMQAIQMRGATISSYTRGLDLSLSLKGAAGIGGLLAQSTPAHSYYHSDGNGNITYLMKADQSLGASYRYDDAYGNVVTTSGTLSNPFRFSSKEWLPRISAYYYGYRFYYPAIQRWLNRDPIGERGGINLYGFAHNNPINSVDKDGHMPWGAGAVIGVGVGLGYCLDRYAACPLRVAAALYNAQSEADRVAPDGSTHAQRGTAIEGGDADALTHCIAACNLGKRPYPCMGADGALEVLQSHEKGNDIGTQIDRLNNEAGIGIGVGLAPGDSCTTKCLEALRNGMLKKIENGQIVSSSVL